MEEAPFVEPIQNFVLFCFGTEVKTLNTHKFNLFLIFTSHQFVLDIIFISFCRLKVGKCQRSYRVSVFLKCQVITIRKKIELTVMTKLELKLLVNNFFREFKKSFCIFLEYGMWSVAKHKISFLKPSNFCSIELS